MICGNAPVIVVDIGLNGPSWLVQTAEVGDVDRQTWESMTTEQRLAVARLYDQWRGDGQAASPATTGEQPRHLQLGTQLARRVLLVAVIVLLTVVGTVTLSSADTTVAGRMTVVTSTNALSASSYSNGGSCVTYGGYDDIAEGTAVTVRDSTGAIVGVGSLGAGQGSAYGCSFPFTVTDVPDSDFYTVEISHRGAMTFTAEDIRTSELQLSLG